MPAHKRDSLEPPGPPAQSIFQYRGDLSVFAGRNPTDVLNLFVDLMMLGGCDAGCVECVGALRCVVRVRAPPAEHSTAQHSMDGPRRSDRKRTQTDFLGATETVAKD